MTRQPEFIPVSSLEIDWENPRLDEPRLTQVEAIRAVIEQQKTKIVTLAKDIVENGINPSDLLLVTKSENDGRFVVLEGNRRVTAIKILEHPAHATGILENNLVRQLNALSETYLENPINELLCSVVDNRDDANHWIELRHTGENDGAGLVSWGGAETARFRHRSGRKEPHLQILDFLEDHGDISREERLQVPVTTLKRLISTPLVRQHLGIDIEKGNIVTRVSDDNELAKGLVKVVTDIGSGNIKARDIHTAQDRIDYIKSLMPEQLPNPTAYGNDLRLINQASTGSSDTTTSATQSRQKSKSPSRKRSTLIPKVGFAIWINDTRVNQVYDELRNIPIDRFPNAVAVLYRVFLELSLDSYIIKRSTGLNLNAKLQHKLTHVADQLLSLNCIDEHYAKVIKSAAQSNTFLATTITTLHQYVHNPYFSPAPVDLKTSWDNLQSFIQILWSNLAAQDKTG